MQYETRVNQVHMPSKSISITQSLDSVHMSSSQSIEPEVEIMIKTKTINGEKEYILTGWEAKKFVYVHTASVLGYPILGAGYLGLRALRYLRK